ncbi:MAG: hypothetical protein EA369_09850 [Bradymonadales bacterium]|nr:MAG: hypothetical protein EA369_09850 [Bradymonadales bacterium]
MTGIKNIFALSAAFVLLGPSPSTALEVKRSKQEFDHFRDIEQAPRDTQVDPYDARLTRAINALRQFRDANRANHRTQATAGPNLPKIVLDIERILLNFQSGSNIYFIQENLHRIEILSGAVLILNETLHNFVKDTVNHGFELSDKLVEYEKENSGSRRVSRSRLQEINTDLRASAKPLLESADKIKAAIQDDLFPFITDSRAYWDAKYQVEGAESILEFIDAVDEIRTDIYLAFEFIDPAVAFKELEPTSEEKQNWLGQVRIEETYSDIQSQIAAYRRVELAWQFTVETLADSLAKLRGSSANLGSALLYDNDAHQALESIRMAFVQSVKENPQDSVVQVDTIVRRVENAERALVGIRNRHRDQQQRLQRTETEVSQR